MREGVARTRRGDRALPRTSRAAGVHSMAEAVALVESMERTGIAALVVRFRGVRPPAAADHSDGGRSAAGRRPGGVRLLDRTRSLILDLLHRARPSSRLVRWADAGSFRHRVVGGLLDVRRRSLGACLQVAWHRDLERRRTPRILRPLCPGRVPFEGRVGGGARRRATDDWSRRSTSRGRFRCGFFRDKKYGRPRARMPCGLSSGARRLGGLL